MKCPNCEKTIKTGAKFCSNCGASLVKKCKKCHLEMNLDEKFCSNCGFDNTQEYVSPASKAVKDAAKKTKKAAKSFKEYMNIRRIGAVIELSVSILYMFAWNFKLPFYWVSLMIFPICCFVYDSKAWGFLSSFISIIFIVNCLIGFASLQAEGYDVFKPSILVYLIDLLGPVLMCCGGEPMATYHSKTGYIYYCPNCRSIFSHDSKVLTDLCPKCHHTYLKGTNLLKYDWDRLTEEEKYDLTWKWM